MKTIALFHNDNIYANDLIERFKKELPNHNVVLWQEDMSANYLITWKASSDIFKIKNLEVIFGLGAGVDAFLSSDIDEKIHIVRLEEAGMGNQMLEIVLYGILHYSRDMINLRIGQKNQRWLDISTPKAPPFSTKVGVLGLGQLGGFVAKSLANIGYRVSGYSNSLKNIDNINCFSKDSLDDFLKNSQVLINLLPLTTKTENILNKSLFSKLPKGSYLINIARGKHLVEDDFLDALNSGQISGALLDVFRKEPLPKNHDFWQDDRIIITPHLAAITLKDEAVKQISKNIVAYEKNERMTGAINRKKGY